MLSEVKLSYVCVRPSSVDWLIGLPVIISSKDGKFLHYAPIGAPVDFYILTFGSILSILDWMVAITSMQVIEIMIRS